MNKITEPSGTGKKKKIILLAAAAAAVAAAVLLLVLKRGGTDNYAYVQTVSDIVEQNGGVVLSDRYSGVVEAKNIVKFRLDEDKKLEECFVEVGDDVKEGDPLFSYNIEKLQMTYQQLLIDYETELNNCTSYNEEIRSLEKQMKKAKAKSKAELNVQLQTAKLNLMKSEFESGEKKEQLDEAEAILKDNIVRAPSAGTVRAIKPPTSDSDTASGSVDEPYMTIVSKDDLWIKGTISEQGAYRLAVGTSITVRSRVNEKQTWSGHIEKVNTEQPVENNSNYYYSDNNGESSSKYAFYVALDSADDLMMGQHVYIEFGTGSTASGIWLISGYLLEENGSYYVFADDGNGKIEKRPVTVGTYDEETDSYQIVSGLTAMDRIAFPDGNVHAGMRASDAGYAEGEPEEGTEPEIMDGKGAEPEELMEDVG